MIKIENRTFKGEGKYESIHQFGTRTTPPVVLNLFQAKLKCSNCIESNCTCIYDPEVSQKKCQRCAIRQINCSTGQEVFYYTIIFISLYYYFSSFFYIFIFFSFSFIQCFKFKMDRYIFSNGEDGVVYIIPEVEDSKTGNWLKSEKKQKAQREFKSDPYQALEPVDCEDWTVHQVSEWLSDNDLGDLKAHFRVNEVDGQKLPKIEIGFLIGLTPRIRKRFFNALTNLKLSVSSRILCKNSRIADQK